ncbi:MAG: glycosyltransferase family 2 protein [Lachnospiraceae bacterium]|nr:glycosyltransferase family 2 protein [Lachnospiraceae bacterium]
MKEVTVVIPNYNGMKYLKICLDALRRQTLKDLVILVVDNGSEDDSVSFVREQYPEAELICLPENTGFCGAVNAGIRATKTPYVLLLNNDTEVFPDFCEELLKGIKSRKKAFSVAGKLLQYHDKTKIDDAGNYYCALGWAFARGKDRSAELFEKPERIFSACAGAAIYSMELLQKTGLFDEAHFAYLEDMDLGYRARIFGYENWYLPSAKVYHVGSGTSGSRYNTFKTGYSARNNVYLIHKNMPLFQVILNLPFLIMGFAVKGVFFQRKGLGAQYRKGIRQGLALGYKRENKSKKIRFQWKHLGNYIRIQLELWINLVRVVISFLV